MSSTANSVKPSKASAFASVRALIAGTQKHTPNGSLTFGNATYAAASLVQLFQQLDDAMTAHDQAQVKAKDLLLALRDVVSKVGPVLRAYRRFLVATYGNATETLADYGLKPLKARAPQTVDQKAKAVAKVRATRKSAGDHEQEAEGFDPRSGHDAGRCPRRAAHSADEAGDLVGPAQGVPAALAGSASGNR